MATSTYFFCAYLLVLASICSISRAWTLYKRHNKNIKRTPVFSEEGSGYSGRQTVPIAGIICEGDYCDNKRLVVVREGETAPLMDSGHWTRWFTDGNPSSANCPAGMLVNELQCSGRYCDDIRLQCGNLNEDYRIVSGRETLTDWFSEEEGERLCPDGYYMFGMECRDHYCDGIRLACVQVEHKPIPAAPKNVLLDSMPFTPIFFFDGSAQDYCVPDIPSAQNQGKCRKDWSDQTSVYVEHTQCNGIDVYTFWLWYGWQKACFAGYGSHDNDWEHVSLHVRDGLVMRVTFFQHSGHYTRKRGKFEQSGERPHVYIGKIAHGSYHASCTGVCSLRELFSDRTCLGSVNYCQGGCLYWDDFRNPGRKVHHLHVKDLKRGEIIDGVERPKRVICVDDCYGSADRISLVTKTNGCWQNDV